MAEPIIIQGLPARITVQDFLRYYGQKFPRLIQAANQDIVEDAINDMYAMFFGVQSAWDHLGEKEWFEKTQLCFRYLVAWYIVDTSPMFAPGIQSTGGLNVQRKKIGPVDITFNSKNLDRSKGMYEDLLGQLNSNTFGAKAYMMLRMNGKRAMLRNRKSV